jgi:hypothetical protein
MPESIAKDRVHQRLSGQGWCATGAEQPEPIEGRLVAHHSETLRSSPAMLILTSATSLVGPCRLSENLKAGVRPTSVSQTSEPTAPSEGLSDFTPSRSFARL